MKKLGVVLLLLMIGYFLYRQRSSHVETILPLEKPVVVKTKPHVTVPPADQPKPATVVSLPIAPPVVATHMVQPADPKKKRLTLPYTLEGDIAIVQGDVIVGTIVNKDAPEHGIVEVPEIKLWPAGTIAYHIQPSLSNPDRVRAALDMFQGTAVQFVEYTNQDDALVFEEGSGVCKSYVGRMGGLQPVYIPAGCGPHEIAHEIMHALGFVHEQNRADRDDYIQVNLDNIDEGYAFNFDKLPPEFMKVSGITTFDFESIMIYPNTMFAKGSQPTMQPLDRTKQIQPSYGLSKSDIDRINQAYR